MKVKLHEPTFGEEEIQAAVEVLRSTNVTSGKLVKEFESKFGFHAVMCNSGSSANLLAIAALCNPLNPRLQPGDEVIVSGLSWSTTIWPLVQHGLVPVIVDIDPDTLNIDPKEIEKAITPKTKAIMPVHVYGNPCDMKAINEFGLIVISDCCEALGAEIEQSDFNTYSFYFSHHITTLEGGMVTCKTTEQADMLRTIRCHGWTREQVNRQHYEGIDDKFLFVTAGYNLRSSEVNAAIGLVQFDKLEYFVENRRKAARMLTEIFKDHVGIQKDMGSSWFGFSIITEDAKNLRAHFEADNIETRSIICGNIARQPGMKLYPHRVIGGLSNADRVMKDGFSIGCHQDIGENECEYIADSFRKYRCAH